MDKGNTVKSDVGAIMMVLFTIAGICYLVVGVLTTFVFIIVMLSLLAALFALIRAIAKKGALPLPIR